MRRPRGTVAGALVGLVLASGACSGGGGAEAPAAAPEGPVEVYLAVGADATLGIGTERPLVDEWPKVLFRTALPATRSS